MFSKVYWGFFCILHYCHKFREWTVKCFEHVKFRISLTNTTLHNACFLYSWVIFFWYFEYFQHRYPPLKDVNPSLHWKRKDNCKFLNCLKTKKTKHNNKKKSLLLENTTHYLKTYTYWNFAWSYVKISFSHLFTGVFCTHLGNLNSFPVQTEHRGKECVWYKVG